MTTLARGLAAFRNSPVGRHVAIYAVGAGCVQLVAQGRRILESANLLSASHGCANCMENRAPQMHAEARTPAPEGDPLPDSPAYDEEAPTPTVFGVNGAGDVDQLAEPAPEQPTV